MKQIYILRAICLCLFISLFSFSPIQASSTSIFFNDGGTISADQTVELNVIPDPLIETSAPTISGPYEYLWMQSIPSDPVLNEWHVVPGSVSNDPTLPSLSFSDFLTVTTMFTRCVRLQGSTDSYVETNVVVITVLNILPIDLVSFDAFDNGNGTVKLNWMTASERDNEYFQLEYSNDGLEFEIIKRIEGAINSDELKTYTYTDKSPSYGQNYYRLKQVDTNGDFEYSEIISLKITNGFPNIISIFPNPVIQELNVKINAPLNKNSNLEVLNTMGQVVFRLDSLATLTTSIDIEDLPFGTYFVRIVENNTIILQDKIVKLK